MITHPATSELIPVQVGYSHEDRGVMMRENENLRNVVARIEMSDDTEIPWESLSEWERERLQREIDSAWAHENEIAREMWRAGEWDEDFTQTP